MDTKLSKEAQEDAKNSLKRFLVEELEITELSDFRIQFLLDFIIKEIGPFVYNKAIKDAQSYFQERTLDIDGTCYQDELTYWKPKKRKR